MKNKLENLITRKIKLTKLQHSLKNIHLNSHLLNSAIYDSKALVERNKEKQIVFGGSSHIE